MNRLHLRRRGFGLALTFAALALIATAMTAQAFVARMTETTLDDFASGTFHKTGLLDIPPNIDSVQLLPVGLTGDWQPDRSLPIGLVDLFGVAAGGHVVVMGGQDADFHYHDEVYVSAIGDQGALGPWTGQAHPLPQPMAAAAAAVYPKDDDESFIYVLGGIAGGNSFNTVFYTTLDHTTGTIGPWTTSVYTLPVPAHYLAAAAMNGYLYVAGGYSLDPPFDNALDEVFYAPIQSDGSLGPWQGAPSLPQPLASHLLVAFSEESIRTLYVVGGSNLKGSSSYRVYFADAAADGSLSDWVLSQGNLPATLYGHGGALVNDQIIVTGGVDASDTPSNTVKAALVDPGNPTFRLYDWCLGVPPPACTIGAWQSGRLLPQRRAFHISVEDGGYIYTIGGVDVNGNPTNTVYRGTVNGQGALYSPDGYYLSSIFDFQIPSTLHRVEWDATIAYPTEMTLDLSYRYKTQGGDWTAWSTPIASTDGLNTFNFDPPVPNVRLFQYRLDMTTDVTTTSPLFNRIDVYYEVPDPEVAVRKDTGGLISVPLGFDLDYTIYYTNNGGWMAEDVVLSETLPANTSYIGGADWQQVGSSNVYTYLVGNLARGATGEATFRVHVADSVPPGTRRITDVVDIGFPPMIDAFGQIIGDPVPANNHYEFSNALTLYAVAITKDATPPPGSEVEPGSTITYTIHYENIGLVDAVQAVVTDTYDPEGDYTILSINPPPSQGNNVWNLGVLAPGHGGEIVIVARLQDSLPGNWPITNRAAFHSSSGPSAFTPLITHRTPRAPAVDLTAQNVRWQPDNPAAGSPVEFYATIANAGRLDAGEFWLELYIKPWPSDPPSRPADHDYGYCLNNCQTLRPDYTLLVSNLPAGFGSEFHFVDSEPKELLFPENGMYQVCVQVDVAFGSDNPYWGHYPEEDESNNLVCQTLSIGTPTVYLPLITKHAP